MQGWGCNIPIHGPRWITTLFIMVMLGMNCNSQAPVIPAPRITEVSAMCNKDGITANVMFDRLFSGKIYSSAYPLVHDCVYYNVKDMNMIIFSIPNYKCGTQLARDANNNVNHIENEVYVQFEKDAQSGIDRRFLFVCDSNPEFGFSGTFNPSQTVIVQTIEPTKIEVTQQGVGRPQVVLQVQEGAGPFQNTVSRPLKLGEDITLVVMGKQLAKDTKAYRMFVHSCFATDGAGDNRIDILDRSGCTLRSSVAGKLERTHMLGDTVYYLPMKAFKFPASDDVYFSCSVDVCSGCNFAEVCPPSGIAPSRQKRSNSMYEALNTSRSLKLEHFAKPMPPYAQALISNPTVDEVQLHGSVTFAKQQPLNSVGTVRKEPFCFTGSAIGGILASFACTLIALVSMTIYLLITTRVTRKRKTNQLRYIPCSPERSVSSIGSVQFPESYANPPPDPQKRWENMRETWNYGVNYDGQQKYDGGYIQQ